MDHHTVRPVPGALTQRVQLVQLAFMRPRPGTLCQGTLRTACEGESLHTLSSAATPCQHTHAGKVLQLLVPAVSCNT